MIQKFIFIFVIFGCSFLRAQTNELITGDLQVEGITRTDGGLDIVGEDLHVYEAESVYNGRGSPNLKISRSGTITLLRPAGDIPMGMFGAQEPYFVYRSSFSDGVDEWNPEGSTFDTSSGTSLVVQRPGGVRMKRDSTFLKIGSPHKITAVFSGLVDVDVRSWNPSTSGWDTLYSDWDGVSPIVVTPLNSTSLRLQTSTGDPIELISFDVELL